MSKKILGLLLALCLVVGLLPVAALADATDGTATIKFGIDEYKLTGFDTPIYTVNKEETAQDGEKNDYTRVCQSTEGATEENYNAKIVWKTGDQGPTIYLRNFIFDEHNEANNDSKTSWLYYDKVKADGTTTWSTRETYAITTPDTVPSKIVLQGNESLIKTRNGIVFKNNLTIESEGDAKLVMRCRNSGIYTNTKTSAEGAADMSMSLTVNANLDITLPVFYGSYASHALMSFNGDITINGGNINLKVLGAQQSIGIYAYGTKRGNVIINGGTINTNSVVGEGQPTNGAIKGNKVIINGGETNITPDFAVGIQGDRGVDITGGVVNINAPDGGIHTGTDSATGIVTITGGTVTISAQLSGAFYKPPTLGAGITGLAGDTEAEAATYDESLFGSKYIKLTSGSAQEPTQAPTEAPTQAPTEAPTQAPTEAPTQAPTEAPTQAPTEAPTQGATQAPTEAPTQAPTEAPTQGATQAPTEAPTQAPTEAPTQGATQAPTEAPTQGATQAPTEAPTQGATQGATQAPTQSNDNPATGDSSIVLFTTLLFVATFGVVATVAFGKKSRIVA